MVLIFLLGAARRIKYLVNKDNELEKSKRKQDARKLRDHKYLPARHTKFPATTCAYKFPLERIFAVACMLFMAYVICNLFMALHENDMWFSNIKDVEREISFRTESGLFYSYYKQLLKSKSFTQGLFDLMNDNRTEHTKSINVLARMNIYQEVTLAAFYKFLPFIQNWMEPIYFYIYSVFFLHGLQVCALFLLSWVLADNWMAGLLTTLFYVFNNQHLTRVYYVIPLRESFSLPFFWLQMLFVTLLFKKDVPTEGKLKNWISLGLSLSMFLFCITWQFNQFILILQSLAVFCLQVFHLVPFSKLSVVYEAQFFSLLAVWLFQFCNKIILSGTIVSFVPTAYVIMLLQKKFGRPDGMLHRLWQILLFVTLQIVGTVVLHCFLKFLIEPDADEHIYRFALSKFGFQQYTDFNVQLYMCNDAFMFLPFQTFSDLHQHSVLLPYVIVHAVIILLSAVHIFQYLGGSSASILESRPELVYSAGQAILFAGMGMAVLRLKFLWTSYMCIFASLIFTDKPSFIKLAKLLKCPRYVKLFTHWMPILIIVLYMSKEVPPVQKQLLELREFHDPDTVELMEWINESTSPKASFAGTMQLLAGVKLCTERHITNHPHYEDKSLRDRTREIYQMYTRKMPQEVHQLLRKYDTNYIILEDSQCLHRGRQPGCHLPDILDNDNGELHHDQPRTPGLKHSSIPRFCNEIRYGAPEYRKYFTLVLENPTFRVYKVL